MKKLLSSVSLSALALCLTVQFAHGIDIKEKEKEEEAKGNTVLKQKDEKQVPAQVPLELKREIISYSSKVGYTINEEKKGRYDIYFDTLFAFRRVSKDWKKAADEVIIKDNLLITILDASKCQREATDIQTEVEDHDCFLFIHVNPFNFQNLPEGLGGLLTDMRFKHSAGYGEGEENFDIGWYTNFRTFPEVKSLQILSTKPYDTNEIEYNATAHEQAIPALLQPLDSFPNLRTLKCFFPIGEKGGEILGKILPKLPHLEAINLEGARMGPEGTVHFAAGLKHENLKTLELTYNFMGDAGIKAIANKLEELPNLEIVQTYSDPAWTKDAGLISEEGAKYFKEKVEEHNPKIKYSLI